MAPRLQIPREHGLIVVWLNTFLISIFVSKSYSLYGILTIIILSSTFIIYDPLINVLRLRNAKRGAVHYLLSNYAYVPAIFLIIAIWLLFEVLSGKLSIYVILFVIALYAALYLLFPFGERKAYTRSISIVSITSFLLIIISSFTETLNSQEISLFIAFSLIEVMLGLGPVEIVNAKKEKKRFAGIFLRRMLPVYAFSMAVLIGVSIYLTKSLWIFTIIYSAGFLSFPFIKTWKMNKIGLVVTIFNVIVLLCASIIFFRSV